MAFKKTKLLLAISAASTLSGCFGGESSGSGSLSSKEATSEIIGKVVDGYIESATVCYDANNNLVCDKGEKTTQTNSDGEFTLDIPKSMLNGYGSILAELTPGISIDKDTGQYVTEKSTLSLSTKGLKNSQELTVEAINEGGSAIDKSNAIISPASHIVNIAIKSKIASGTPESNTTAIEEAIEQAKTSISALTNVSTENALEDWVSLRNSEATSSVKKEWWKAQQLAMAAVISAKKEVEIKKITSPSVASTLAFQQEALNNAIASVSTISETVDDTLLDSYDSGFLNKVVQINDNQLNVDYFNEVSGMPGGTISLGGKVFDTDYIDGATVCVDGNNNQACDIDEIQATTDQSGFFELKGLSPEVLNGFSSIIAEIPSETNPSLENSYVLSSNLNGQRSLEEIKLNLNDGEDYKDSLELFISPASHYINSYIQSSTSKQYSELTNVKLIALNELSNLSGMSVEDIESNYLSKYLLEENNDSKVSFWNKIEFISSLLVAADKQSEIMLTIDPSLNINYSMTKLFIEQSLDFVNDYIQTNPIPSSLTTVYIYDLVSAYENKLKQDNFSDLFENNGVFSMLGKVSIGSYISGATVCLDLNKNLSCDNNEPTSTTDSSGVFTLDNIPLELKDSFNGSVIAEIPSFGAKAIRTGSDYGKARVLSANLKDYASKVEKELVATSNGTNLNDSIDFIINPSSHLVNALIQSFISNNSVTTDFAINAVKSQAFNDIYDALGISGEESLTDLYKLETTATEASEAQDYYLKQQVLMAVLETAYKKFEIEKEITPGLNLNNDNISSYLIDSLNYVADALSNIPDSIKTSFSDELYSSLESNAVNSLLNAVTNGADSLDFATELNNSDISSVLTTGLYGLDNNGQTFTKIDNSKVTLKVAVNEQDGTFSSLSSQADVVILKPNGEFGPLYDDNSLIEDNSIVSDFGTGTITTKYYALSETAKARVFSNLIPDKSTTLGNIYIKTKTFAGDILKIVYDQNYTAQEILDEHSKVEDINGHTVYSYLGARYIIKDNLTWLVEEYFPDEFNPLTEELDFLTESDIAFDSQSYNDYLNAWVKEGESIATESDFNSIVSPSGAFSSDDYTRSILLENNQDMSITCSSDELFNQETNTCYAPEFNPNISGKVLDTYVQDATVCIDINKNWSCDSGEPSTTTDSNGEFKLTGFNTSDLDGADDYLLSEIKPGVSKDSSSTSTYTQKAVLSLNAESLSYDASGTYSSNKSLDSLVNINPFTNEINISVRNAIEQGSSPSSPVIDSLISSKETSVAEVFTNSVLDAKGIYSDAYQLYLDSGEDIELYKAQQSASAMISMQKAYQDANYTSQDNFVLSTPNLLAQSESIYGNFKSAFDSIFEEDTLSPGFTYPTYITNAYLSILNTEIGDAPVTDLVKADVDNSIESIIRTDGLYKFREFSLTSNQLSYIADKTTSVNQNNFEMNTIHYDSSKSSTIFTVDPTVLTSDYDKFTVGIDGSTGMLRLAIPQGVAFSQNTSTINTLGKDINQNNYVVDPSYASRLIKAAFNIDDTIKDNIFSSGAAIFYQTTGSSDTYTIMDDTTLDYSTDVEPNYIRLENVGGAGVSTVAETDTGLYVEFGGVTYSLQQGTASEPNVISDSSVIGVTAIAFNETAWNELKTYIENNTVLSLSSTSNFNSEFNYDVDNFDLNDYLDQVKAN